MTSTVRVAQQLPPPEQSNAATVDPRLALFAKLCRKAAAHAKAEEARIGLEASEPLVAATGAWKQ